MTAVEVGDRTVEVTNRDRVLFPDDGITKGALVDYYRRIADVMLPHLRHRALVLRRFPDGIEEPGFFQKDVAGQVADWVRTVRIDKRSGGSTTYAVCDEAATLVHLANLSCVEAHTLLAPTGEPDRPDQLILDLDPPDDHTALVVAGARAVRAVLDGAGIASFVKSTGSRGLHILVPLDGRAYSADDVRERLTRR